MNRRQRGFALLIVLWTIGFLALLGTRIVTAGRLDTQLATNLKQEAELQAAADGAIADVVFLISAARTPAMPVDGAVRQLRVGRIPILVRIENESDRVNLNTASAPLLQALITQVGDAPANADRLAAAILDWRTSGETPRRGGAKAPDYRAAGLAYGPPGVQFQSVDELADVLGMTPDLLRRLAPHLTVLTDVDPDMSTSDPVVARALADSGGQAGDVVPLGDASDQTWRITVTAEGSGAARYSEVVVASADFQNIVPRVKILLQEGSSPITINPALASRN